MTDSAAIRKELLALLREYAASMSFVEDPAVINITTPQFATIIGVATSTLTDWIRLPRHPYFHVNLVPHQLKNPDAKRPEFLWNKKAAIEWAEKWTDESWAIQQERRAARSRHLKTRRR